MMSDFAQAMSYSDLHFQTGRPTLRQGAERGRYGNREIRA
jgi:hypothetical protein